MSAERQNTLRIRTPEGVEFSFLLAGPIPRSMAWAIDAFVMLALFIGVMFLGAFETIFGADAMLAIMILIFFAIQLGYAIGQEWLWNGQTIGKRLMKLRVVDSQGLQLQFSQVVIRNLLRVIDAIPLFYFVGGVTTLLNRGSQRLGDLAASTVVIRNHTPRQPDLARVLSGKFNSLRQYPHLTARLQQRISPSEATIALQALLRRDELDSTARVELFESLADHFKEVVKFPEEITEGISDENHVRNVVDVLFNPRNRNQT